MVEHELLARLGAQLGPVSARVLVGIGDDAAVLSPSGKKLVVTNDASVEGVHFTREIASLEDFGFRATMAAASDLAAMGATPLAALSALMAPADVVEADLQAIFAGQRDAANALGAPIVGGNLSRGPGFALATTWLGEAEHPVLRTGARVGDRVWIGGELGRAAAGLRALLDGRNVAHAPLDAMAAAWRRPIARIAMSLRVANLISAMIDVSDGAAADAGHLARASGVAVHLDVEALIDCGGTELREAGRILHRDPSDFALAGGEDYALLATSSHDLRAFGFHEVGAVVAGEPSVNLTRHGATFASPPGFDHFR